MRGRSFRTYAGVSAGLFGVITLGLGITNVIHFSLWTAEMKKTKALYDEKQKRLQELEKQK